MPIDSNLLDEPDRSGWLVGVAVVLVAVVVLVLLLGLAVMGVGFSQGEAEGNGANVTNATFGDATCGTHQRQYARWNTRSSGDTTYVTVNKTIPVAAADSTVTATANDLGEDLFRIDLRRSGGNRTTDCYLEVRYNVTVAIPQSREYTVLVSHDGFLTDVEYIRGRGGGGWSTGEVTKPPSMNDSAWQEALNGSEAYNRNLSSGG